MNTFIEETNIFDEDTQDIQNELSVSEESQSTQEGEETQQEGSTWRLIYQGVVESLTRSNLGQIVIRAINQAKLKLNEGRIKASIREMVESGDVETTAMVDVFNELDELIGTVSIDCEQVEESLCPGEVIEISLN